MSSPTSEDVARRAGVSIATVSRVINDLPHVTPGIRRKVQRAIKDLNFQPSRAAQRLRAKRSRVIGLIISDVQNPFFTSVARAIEDLTSRRGYSLILCNTDEETDKERQYIDVMRAEEVAGVIIAATLEKNAHVSRLVDEGIPVVALDRCIQDRRVDSILTANAEGACEAVSYLIRLGHRRIGIINLPLERTSGHERYEGYLRAFRKHRLRVRKAWMRAGDGKEESGYKCAESLLTVRPSLTALFVANNLMTLGAVGALYHHGVAIPQQMSIVGFDDMPAAPLLRTPLTVVAQPTVELGRQAAELLLERIESTNRPVTHLQLKPTLIVRTSSGPAAH